MYLVDLQAIREQPETVANIVILPYKEEVAGSNPASPTLKSVDLQDKCQENVIGLFRRLLLMVLFHSKVFDWLDKTLMEAPPRAAVTF